MLLPGLLITGRLLVKVSKQQIEMLLLVFVQPLESIYSLYVCFFLPTVAIYITAKAIAASVSLCILSCVRLTTL